MTKGKYNINWDDFSATAAERFGPLIREAKFSDVTLVSGDGQRISSHQVILATGCTFFKNLFEEEAASKMPLIFLRGVEASLILPLLDFLYTGKAEVDEELLADFVVLAEDLGVEGLTKSFDITQNETRLEDNEPEDSFESLLQKEAVLEESEKKNKKEATLEESEFENVDSPVSVDQTTSDALEVVKKETAKRYADCCKRLDNRQGSKEDFKSRKESHGTEPNPSKKIIVPKRDEQGFHKCYYCEKKIRDHCNFRRHIQAEHIMLVLNCDHCDYTTRIANNLYRHKKKHQNNL